MHPPIVKIYHFKEDVRIPKHEHTLAQFGFPLKGVLRIKAKNKEWIVPPNLALWIPANFPHRIITETPATMLFVYLSAAEVPNFPTECSIYQITDLLRELILKAEELEKETLESDYKNLLLQAILHELEGLKSFDLQLVFPRDPRAQKAAKYFVKNPASKLSLVEVAKMAGASQRTLSRIYIRETGIPLNKWRQKNKIFQAIPRLAEKDSVSSISYDLGYSSPGSFISMFKKMTGKTPGSFFKT